MLTPIIVLKDAARAPIFWVLFGTFFVCGSSTNGLIQTHFITLCHDYGLAAVTAASAVAMMGFFDFFGTIGSGWLSDRFDNRWLLFWYHGLRGLSLIYLPFTDFTFYGLSLFAVFYGLDWIATVPPTVKLTALAVRRASSAPCPQRDGQRATPPPSPSPPPPAGRTRRPRRTSPSRYGRRARRAGSEAPPPRRSLRRAAC
jgi:hypothetical protein